jgi:hypothetical protein
MPANEKLNKSKTPIVKIDKTLEKLRNKNYNPILASTKDQEVFFYAITNSQKPNNELKKAAIRFNKQLIKNELFNRTTECFS